MTPTDHRPDRPRVEVDQVRFPLLSNGPKTASINVRKVGDKEGLRPSRANAAAYYLQQLTDVSFPRLLATRQEQPRPSEPTDCSLTVQRR
ncbi:hypothetical protein AQJ46_50450 [Streptomyces canus]|uniref:Uncharacterized protein n=1 Tax=Streptomyces canus TaxID=58343 RepID=A0A101RJU1_9ACTN|nr:MULTISPECIES: hypothetical protein [Streptomyces]KUN53271.1 hypothetical protein AQJ46_50450 [Streptomyces canus]MDI5907449.1 hypothetical protein [Streptomyces sp. 12257]